MEAILSEAQSKENCPAKEDRLEIFQKWSCDEYSTYVNLQLVFDIDVYIVKTTQVIFFGWLLALILLRQRCKKDRSVG